MCRLLTAVHIIPADEAVKPRTGHCVRVSVFQRDCFLAVHAMVFVACPSVLLELCSGKIYPTATASFPGQPAQFLMLRFLSYGKCRIASLTPPACSLAFLSRFVTSVISSEYHLSAIRTLDFDIRAILVVGWHLRV